MKNGNSAQCPMAGCNVPEGECSGACLKKETSPYYNPAIHGEEAEPDSAVQAFNARLETKTPLDSQVGGDHYKKLGQYQPWEVLRHWLTPEEFRGYMKGTAIAYLAREAEKGGDQDIAKAEHTLQGLLHLIKE